MTGTSNQRIEAERQHSRVEDASRRELREGLLEVGRRLGWDQHTVIRVSETITGRPWLRSGDDDVLRVARVLLEIATALRSRSGANTFAHPDGDDVDRNQRLTLRAVDDRNGTAEMLDKLGGAATRSGV
jgi:hypothetical protein